VIIGGAFHFCSLLREFVIVVIVVVVIVIVVIVIVIVVIVVVVVVIVTLLLLLWNFTDPAFFRYSARCCSGCSFLPCGIGHCCRVAITVTAKIYVHCLYRCRIILRSAWRTGGGAADRRGASWRERRQSDGDAVAFAAA
jgi:hypothetical protein